MYYIMEIEKEHSVLDYTIGLLRFLWEILERSLLESCDVPTRLLGWGLCAAVKVFPTPDTALVSNVSIV